MFRSGPIVLRGLEKEQIHHLSTHLYLPSGGGKIKATDRKIQKLEILSPDRAIKASIFQCCRQHQNLDATRHCVSFPGQM